MICICRGAATATKRLEKNLLIMKSRLSTDGQYEKYYYYNGRPQSINKLQY